MCDISAAPVKQSASRSWLPSCQTGLSNRPNELDSLVRLLLADDHTGTAAITTALVGAGGFGKTTLAAAICHDRDIQTAFDDGILWVTLGPAPDIVTKITELYAALSGERPYFVSDADASYYLSQKMRDRHCLLVIDDVWHGKHLAPFVRSGTRCARLITTRQTDVCPGASQVHIDQMRRAESLAMLKATLDPDHVNGVDDLVEGLGDWPLLVELVRSTLRHRLAQGDTVAGAVAFVERARAEKGIRFFRNMTAGERLQNITDTLRMSLDLLSAGNGQRYLDLAILREHTGVSLAVLQVL